MWTAQLYRVFGKMTKELKTKTEMQRFIIIDEKLHIAKVALNISCYYKNAADRNDTLS